MLTCVAEAVRGDEVEVGFQDGKGDHSAVFDKLIVAVGRRPNTVGLASDEASLLLDEWGLIHVDEQCRTNLPGVYAIGDAVRGPMLAHKAAHEGKIAAEDLAGVTTEWVEPLSLSLYGLTGWTVPPSSRRSA